MMKRNTVKVSSLMKMMNRGSHSMMNNNLIKRKNNMVKICNTVRRKTLKKKCKRTFKASMKKSKTVARMMSKLAREKSQ